MTPAKEYKLSKIAILAECIIDIAKTLEKDELGLVQAATSIYNTAEQIKVNERILDDLKVQEAISNVKNDLETVKYIEELPETGDPKTLYITLRGKMYFYDSGKPIEIGESKEITAFDFVEMFDNAREDHAEVLTKEGHKKLVITKFLMFPENSYSIDIGGGYAVSPCNKMQLAEFLNENGILSYTLTKVECR